MYPHYFDYIAPQWLTFALGQPYRNMASYWYSPWDGPGSALRLDTPRGMVCAFFSDCGEVRIEDLRV